MVILVTGGAGYIGSVAVKQLMKKGHRVLIFDNLSTGHKRLIHQNAVFYKGDLLKMEDIESVFDKEKVDAVMHFAAFSLVGESVLNPQKYFINNICGTLHLLKAMIAHSVLNIIFSSSAAIFGNPNEIPIVEDALQYPTNPYGQSKKMIENILQEYDRAYGVRSVCLRYFNAAGADSEVEFGEMHDPETHLIPVVLKTLKGEKMSVKIFGTNYPTPDGTCLRDYIHVEDLIDAHILSLDFLFQEKRSEEFNLGNERGYSVREIIEQCEKVTGKDIQVEEADRRPGDPAILIASSEKIKKMLKWKPKKDLVAIIQDAWRWEQTL